MFSSLLRRDGWRNLSKSVVRKDRPKSGSSVLSESRMTRGGPDASAKHSNDLTGMDSSIQALTQSVVLTNHANSRIDLDMGVPLQEAEVTRTTKIKVPPLNFSTLPNH